ncbi:HNH endonuclease [Rhodococcus triatomae]|uniref:HNH endonuclease signature motif containing protein n=1 Tax=Rhodococcus triatomae TaxID=300028 RepID=UPI0031B5C2C6
MTRQSGGMQSHLSRRIKQLGIDTTHFTGRAHNRGQRGVRRRAWQEILVLRPDGSARVKPHMLRRALVESGVPYSCARCELPARWRDGPLTLHVDHIDGNHLDSRPTNVRFLCPNCHSQTPTWAGRNRWWPESESPFPQGLTAAEERHSPRPTSGQSRSSGAVA